MSQDDELGAMPADPTAVRAACERLQAELLHLCWCCYQLGAGQPFNLEPTEANLASQQQAIEAFRANPEMTAEQNHENWMAYKISQGWVYGPVKDETAKTHPDLIPFGQLPEVERLKDEMDLMCRRVILEGDLRLLLAAEDNAAFADITERYQP